MCKARRAAAYAQLGGTLEENHLFVHRVLELTVEVCRLSYRVGNILPQLGASSGTPFDKNGVFLSVRTNFLSFMASQGAYSLPAAIGFGDPPPVSAPPRRGGGWK